jgi:N-acetyl-anhydromuramyl-L-alanine amidase AmpD
MAEFRAAAREFGVPVKLLLAVGYEESRWQSHGTGASADGGYGLMDLTGGSFPASDQRGVPAGAGKAAGPTAGGQAAAGRTHGTLGEAARLLHVSQAALRTSEPQNVRGAAAVLASLARGLAGGQLPATLGGWYPALAAYSGATYRQTAELFASDVLATLRTGASLVTRDGQAMRLAATGRLRPDRGPVARLGLRREPASASNVDCPPSLHCQFVPAAYQENPGGDPGNYGDYDMANRPAGLRINSIVIHDTEESYPDTIATFQNPESFVSANYVIQSATGDITEMVRPQNVAWAVGDWYYNTHSISIEHEGYAAQGATWYTQIMYKNSAELVRYLAHRFNVPLNREHIVGHDNVGGPTDADNATQHWDPGPFWNWQSYMGRLQGMNAAQERASAGTARPQGQGQRVVSIDPNWATNEPTVTDCQSGTCQKLPKQPASFVYLHSKPSASSPLLSDPDLWPKGTPGTQQDDDWGDKAPYGYQYVVAGQQGNWTGIWFAGVEGWFYNPPGSGQTARYTHASVITPKAGLSSIPVYGSAFPEASAYPKPIPVSPNAPMVYKILAGQAYVTTGSVPDDYYYAKTFNSSLPDDHTVVRGKTNYYQIQLNHRLYYVKAADVVVKHAG